MSETESVTLVTINDEDYEPLYFKCIKLVHSWLV